MIHSPAMVARISGLVAAKDRYLLRIETAVRAERGGRQPLFARRALENLRRQLAATSRRAAEACARQGCGPADLPTPSRRAFQWMAYLAEGGHLEDHLETLRRMAALCPPDGRVLIRLDHIGSLYRIEHRAPYVRMVASEGFADAPGPVLRSLTRLAIPYARKRAPRLEVQAYAEGRRFSEVLRAVEAAGGAYRSRPMGEFYDLGAVFDRVNHAYFGGRLDSPRILWSERVPSMEFGHFEPATDTVRLSRRLDAPEVPAFVLDHVMYHELLHRALGAERRGDRRRYHSVEFRRRERRFVRFAESEAFLRTLAGE